MAKVDPSIFKDAELVSDPSVLTLQNPPSTNVALAAGASFTLNLSGILVFTDNSGGYIRTYIYHEASASWLMCISNGAGDRQQLCLAQYTRFTNTSTTTAYNVLFIVLGTFRIRKRIEITIGAGGTYYITEKGLITYGDGGGNFKCDIYDGSAWQNYTSNYRIALFYSNGQNMRIRNTSTTTAYNGVILVGVLP